MQPNTKINIKKRVNAKQCLEVHLLIWIQTQIHVPFDPANTTDRNLPSDFSEHVWNVCTRVATAALSVILERRGHAEAQQGPGAVSVLTTQRGHSRYCGQASTSCQRASRHIQHRRWACSLCQPPHKAQRSSWNGDSFLTKSPFIQL